MEMTNSSRRYKTLLMLLLYILMGGIVATVSAWLIAWITSVNTNYQVDKYFYVQNGSIWLIDLESLLGSIRIVSINSYFAIDEDQLEFMATVDDPNLVSIATKFDPDDSDEVAIQRSGRILSIPNNRKQLTHKWMFPNRIEQPAAPQLMDEIYIDRACGWPLLCQRSTEIVQVPTGGNRLNTKCIGGIIAKRGRNGSGVLVISLIPIGIGLVANSVFYGIFIYMITKGVAKAKTVIRRRRGLCTVCAYVIKTDSSHCPECGTKIRDGVPSKHRRV